MLRKQRVAGLFMLVAGALLIGACGPSQPVVTSPTIDANMIYTSAAMTVAAQLTQNAALTPKPSNTPEPSATSAIPTADTSLPTLPLPGAATAPAGTVSPLLPGLPTLTQAAVLPGNPLPSKVTAQWMSNDPADNTVMVAGTKFDIAWRIKNIGTTAWSTDYYITYFSGDKFFPKTTHKLREAVQPGADTVVLVDAVAPSKSGTYFTWWKVMDPQGNRIGDVDVTIVVVQAGETPKAATNTPTVTTEP